MLLIEEISRSWGWTGLVPLRIVKRNLFGNLLVEHENGTVWRITPEELTCELVTDSVHSLPALFSEAEFHEDWEMEGLVHRAELAAGRLEDSEAYCLQLPIPLGGNYNAESIVKLDLVVLHRFAGETAHQIRDLPDGTEIQIRIVD